ncbi:MAG: hypothetical protein KDH94_01915 [Coxiellaceae bacterium]|nr:hypothetical protein [Coxiellaceae bacterium]
MSTLTRSDGTQFVMQAYRELLSGKKKSQLVQEIRLLAEQQGQYVRLFNKGQGQYEAVFSTDPGYLLGETVSHYFDSPENLIYCEALPDSAQVLVVVIRQGSVYIDSQLLSSNLQSELLPLMTGDLRYRIVTSGNVPLRKAESFGTFRFPKDLIESFEMLEDSLFPSLPALKSLQLQPLPLALKAENLSVGFSTTAIIVLVMTLVVGGWWLLTPEQESTVLHQPILRKITNPYSGYFYALSSPAPDQQLMELVKTVNQLYALPGWQAIKIVFVNQEYRINLMPDGGAMSYLHQWAHAHQYQFELTPHGTELVLRSRLSVRAKPRAVYSSEQVVTRLVDQLNQLLSHQAVSLGATQQRGNVKETQLMIHLDAVSPGLLDLVGRQLSGLPVALSSVTISLHSGLMSGTIQLSVWGR